MRPTISRTVKAITPPMMLPPSSHTYVVRPIRVPHVRHRPRSAMKLRSGASSYQLNVRRHASQRDRPPSEAISPREATTPAKDPTAAPQSAAKTTISASNGLTLEWC